MIQEENKNVAVIHPSSLDESNVLIDALNQEKPMVGVKVLLVTKMVQGFVPFAIDMATWNNVTRSMDIQMFLSSIHLE